MDDTTSIEQQQARLRKRLEQLTIEHRDLDEVIDEISRSPSADLVRLQRLKKRKLSIKDEIRSLHQRLLPDIIA
ncbi:MAG: YdcH family protein [Candidatus Puniceispirillales bacterium]